MMGAWTVLSGKAVAQCTNLEVVRVENATALPDLIQMILLWNSSPMILWWSAQSNASSLRLRLYCVYAGPVRCSGIRAGCLPARPPAHTSLVLRL